MFSQNILRQIVVLTSPVPQAMVSLDEMDTLSYLLTANSLPLDPTDPSTRFCPSRCMCSNRLEILHENPSKRESLNFLFPAGQLSPPSIISQFFLLFIAHVTSSIGGK